MFAEAEWVTEQLPTRKPLWFAGFGSALIHGLAVVAILWWWHREPPEQPVVERVFALTLKTEGLKTEGLKTEGLKTESPVLPAPVSAPIKTPTAIAEQHRIPTEHLPVETSPAAEPLHTEAPAETAINTNVTNAMTVAAATVSAFTADFLVPPTQTLSAEQHTLLAEKIQEWQEQLATLDAATTLHWEDAGQQFTANLSRAPQTQSTDLPLTRVEISTDIDGQLATTVMTFKQLAFSHFAQLVNQWDPDVAIANDTITGRFHANSSIVLDDGRDGQPFFFGKVTTTLPVVLGRRLNRDEVFPAGLETRAKRIPLPARLDYAAILNAALLDTAALDTAALNTAVHDAAVHNIAALNAPSLNPAPLSNIAAEQILAFADHATLSFSSDGRYHWQLDANAESFGEGMVHAQTQFFVCASDCTVSVKGQLRGRAVIYSPSRIRIVGNLTYAIDPRLDETSEDFLGLLSDGYVEIAEPDITGAGDLTVHAAIFAKRRFAIKRFRNQNKGLLTIVGSVASGSLSASEPRFATNVIFDKRFETMRLPFFPLTNKHELVEWQPVWEFKPESAAP